jgi:hypothetical protein
MVQVESTVLSLDVRQLDCSLAVDILIREPRQEKSGTIIYVTCMSDQDLSLPGDKNL